MLTAERSICVDSYGGLKEDPRDMGSTHNVDRVEGECMPDFKRDAGIS
jgi:hypothetical protein